MIGYTQSDSLKLITVNQILIEGNKRTKPQIILRELSFSQGSQYQLFEFDSMFVWDGNRIYNTNLFNTVDLSIVNREGDLADVLIEVDERWYFYPVPIFKLIDRNFNDWWVNRNHNISRVNLGLRLRHYNFRGRAEQLRVVAQVGFETYLNFSYQIPYVDKAQKYGLELNFTYQEVNNLAYNTENNIRTFLEGDELLRRYYKTEVGYRYRNSFYSFHTLSVIHNDIHIADTIAQLNSNYLGEDNTEQKFFQVAYGFSWDKRNNRNYPTMGSWHAAGIQKFGLGIYDDVDFWSTNVTISRYEKLKKDWYYAGNIIGLISYPVDRPYSTYFAIGFNQQVLRGYELRIVEGSTYFIQKNEIKKKIFAFKRDISQIMPVRQFQTFPVSLYGKFFFDHGYAQRYPNYEGSILLNDQYLYSYGIGLDFIVIYDAVFRFEFSRNTMGQTNFFINFGTAL